MDDICIKMIYIIEVYLPVTYTVSYQSILIMLYMHNNITDIVRGDRPFYTEK